MATRKESLYAVLGITRKAKNTDVTRAYNRLVAEFRKESTPPDPRREKLIREAFDTLSDEIKREAYDASLRVRPAGLDPKWVVALTAAGVASAAVVYHFSQRVQAAAPAASPQRNVQEILAEATRSIGRVESFDMSGTSAVHGLAVATEEGVMTTSCEGIAPGAQLQVTLGTRHAPARIAHTDPATGLCKLAVEGAASWPLSLSGLDPRAGAKAYATSVNGAGEVVLTEVAVKGIHEEPKGKFVEVAQPNAAVAGAPLLDSQGRIAGLAYHLSNGRYRIVDASWIAERVAPPPKPAAYEPPPPATPPIDKTKSMMELRQERAEKFRPPPKLPEDL